MEDQDHGGGVAGHRGGGHYQGKALDLGANGGRLGNDQDKLFPYVQKFLKTYGLNNSSTLPQTLHATGEAYSPAGPSGGPDGGHNDHLHVEFSKGGRISKPTRALIGEKGPEFIFDADTTRGLDRLAPLLLEKLNAARTKPQLASILQSYAPYESGAEQTVVISREMIPIPILMGNSGSGGMVPSSSSSSVNTTYDRQFANA